MTTISTRLKQAMFDEAAKKRVSQSELSRRSGVPQPTISRILKGQVMTEPEMATIDALARAANVSFEWLRTGKEPRSSVHEPSPGGERQQAPARPEPPPPTKFQRHWLTNEEAELLAEIRSLTPNSQKRLRTITQGMKRDNVDLNAVDKL